MFYVFIFIFDPQKNTLNMSLATPPRLSSTEAQAIRQRLRVRLGAAVTSQRCRVELVKLLFC